MDSTIEYVPLSALQHWQYCPRQCGLIHLEQAFDENVYTLRGQALHVHVDKPGFASVKGIRTERALAVWHDEIGLIGKADAVEFLPNGTPYPVEYKQGNRHKAADIAACDDIQLAAQALCLEFMTGQSVNEGAIFYSSSKRRRIVSISPTLRSAVCQIADLVRKMLTNAQLPPPLPEDQRARKCKACSLLERCQPETAQINLHNAYLCLFNPDA